MKQTRSVELETEDWVSVDAYARRHPGCVGWTDRLYQAAYAVRPPEPRTVEFWGAIWEPTPIGRWRAEGRMTTTNREDALLERIYELEHPDD